MTISTTRRVKTFIGNGLTTVFPYDFFIPDADSFYVTLYDTETTVETVLATNQFEITGLGDEAFGEVTYPLEGVPLPATKKLIIVREIALTQETSIENQSTFYPEVVEATFDKSRMIDQQLQEQVDRSIKVIVGETLDPLPAAGERAGQFMYFDETGQPATTASVISTDGALFATEAEARAGKSSATITSPLRTFQAIAERFQIIFPEDYILDTDPDDTNGMQLFMEALVGGAGWGMLTRWYDVAASVDVDVISSFTLSGIGRYISGIRKNVGFDDHVLSLRGDGTANGITLMNFGVDGKRTSLSGVGHGVRISDVSDVFIEDLYVKDYSDTGIIVGFPTAPRRNAHIKRCHVDGRGVCGNGILISSYDHSSIEDCNVENINGQTPCIGVQFKGCTNSRIVNNDAQGCFVGAALHNSDGGVSNSNINVEGLLVSVPSPVCSEPGALPYGLLIADGFNVDSTNVFVDGNNLDNYRAVNLRSDGMSSVQCSVVNMQGTDAWAFRLGDNSFQSQGILTMMYNVNSVPVQVGTGVNGCSVFFGMVENVRVRAPWQMVDDQSNSSSNRFSPLSGDDYKVFELGDDRMKQFTITDAATSGLLEVWDNSDNEQLVAWVRLSSAPAIQELFAGTEVDTGVGVLTDATTTDGTDLMLNVFVQENEIYIKNRTGDVRTVAFRLAML